MEQDDIDKAGQIEASLHVDQKATIGSSCLCSYSAACPADAVGIGADASCSAACPADAIDASCRTAAPAPVAAADASRSGPPPPAAFEGATTTAAGNTSRGISLRSPTTTAEGTTTAVAEGAHRGTAAALPLGARFSGTGARFSGTTCGGLSLRGSCTITYYAAQSQRCFSPRGSCTSTYAAQRRSTQHASAPGAATAEGSTCSCADSAVACPGTP